MLRKFSSHITGTRKLLAMALPMIVSQASMTIMMFTDRVFLARIGEQHMSAAMIGGLTVFLAMTFWYGIIGYVNALVAQHYGAKKYKDCSLAVSQGAILAVLAYPIILLCIPVGKWLFSISHHDPLQFQLECTYFSILVFSSIIWLLKTALIGFFVGRGKSQTVMVADVIGMIINVPCNYILIFGKLGVPALGVAGAAYGSIIGAVVTLTILACSYLRKRYRKKYDIIGNMRFDMKMFKKLIRFGFPAGAEFFLIIAAFNAIMQQFHSYGSDVAAAVTITTSWDLIAFLPMYGLAIAVTSMVGQNMGAGNIEEAKLAAYRGVFVALIYDIIMVSLFLFATKYLVAIFVTAEEAAAKPIIPTMATTMIRMAALYVFFESAYLCIAGALRGAGDTRSVMRITVISHWFFSVLVVALITVFHTTPIVAWAGFIALPITTAIFVFARFKKGHWKKIKVVDPDAALVTTESPLP
ncbi:MAG: MATE family efflux transporter [Waddliaceae bacterium]|nr:MATE family efflux transporter [Waddliaceae bacterium]